VVSSADIRSDAVLGMWNEGFHWCEKLGEDQHKDWVVARVLLNQRKYFDEITDNPQPGVLNRLQKYFSDDWVNVLLRSIGKFLYSSPIFDLVSVQPFEGYPIASIGYYSPPTLGRSSGDTDVREVNMRVLTNEVRATVRRLGTVHQGTLPDESGAHQMAADSMVQTMFEEIFKIVWQDLLVASQRPGAPPHLRPLDQEIEFLSTMIWRDTMHGPGNVVVMSPRHSYTPEGDSHKVIVVPAMTPREVLVARVGKSHLDAGYVFCPYRLQFHLLSGESGIGLAWRGSKYLVDDRNYQKIRVKTLG